MQTDDLQSIVEALDRAMARCLADGSALADNPALLSSWARLVDRLSLPVPPALRRCAACGTTAPSAAAFCAECFRDLDPLSPLPSA